MPRQSAFQRWCTLSLLAVFTSVLLYFGLPGLAYRMGRALEAGRHDELVAAELESLLAMAAGRQEVLRQAVREVQPGVVRVATVRPAGETRRGARSVPENGCGVIIDRAGFVLTSFQVVSGAAVVRLYLADHPEPFTARVVAGDAETDLALLKFDPPDRGVAPVVLHAADRMDVGELVVAVGDGYDPRVPLSPGTICSRGRVGSPAGCDSQTLIRTTAATLRNCGSPLVNLRGEVVGINVFQEGDDRLPGAAVPISIVRSAAAELRSRGRILRGWLGVYVHPVRELPDHEFPADAIAVCIDYALPNSPADAAGLREGDVIVRVGGEYFTNLREFRRRFAAARLDSPLGLTVVRDEGPHEESVVVATMPVAPPILPAEEQWGIRLWCGLADELTNDPRREGEHVIVVHEIRNPALAGGLRVGDAIMALDGAPIRSLGRLCRELTVRLASPPCERVTLTVRSPHGDRPVSLPLIPAGERGASDR